MRFFSKLWHGEYDKTTFEIINDLTDNKDLQTALCYCWGDFGTVPEKCHFSMMAGLHQHFKLGGFYPGSVSFQKTHLQDFDGDVLLNFQLEELQKLL